SLEKCQIRPAAAATPTRNTTVPAANRNPKNRTSKRITEVPLTEVSLTEVSWRPKGRRRPQHKCAGGTNDCSGAGRTIYLDASAEPGILSDFEYLRAFIKLALWSN